MILVDTSVWVDHLRCSNRSLENLLLENQVLGHSFVIGELACGNLKNRDEILDLLGALPQAEPAGHDEVLHFVSSNRLYGKGIGWVDAHLLASARLSRAKIWTLDKRLKKQSSLLRIAFA